MDETDLIITGVIDGPLPGGIPKAIELYAVDAIADLSIYGLGSANNGGGSDGEEFTFPSDSASAGDFIYVATESVEFQSFFGFAPDYTNGSAPNINGDDAIELFQNGQVVDIFGDINVDGTGQPWEHLDGWTYRVDGTGPDGSAFVLGNWTFSGPNALDNETTNASASTPFPVGTYSGAVSPPPPPSVPLLSIDDVTQAEGDSGDTTFTFTVTRSGDTSGTTTVDFTTLDGTATAGSDYTTATGTLTFQPTDTTQPITVTVTGDTDAEMDESFVVELSNASGAAQVTDAAGFGTIEDDDTFVAPAVVINEVDADQTSTDTTEFIELFDGGAGNTALDGLVLVLFNGSDDASYTAIDLDGFSTDANGYFVIGTGTVAERDATFASVDNNVQNGADAVALFVGNADDFPNDTPVTTTGLVDAIVYDTNDGDDAGLLTGLGETTQFNEDADGTALTQSNSRLPNGTGDFAPANPTPGAANTFGAPYSFDFETPFAGEGWTAFSVDDDTANTWFDDSFGGDNFAEVNAFSDSAPADDWLISPRIDISGLTSPVVSFANTKNFEDNGTDNPEVTFQYSSDYSGTGDPTAATWTPLTYNFSTGNFNEVNSGEIDLSQIVDSELYFAFQYVSSGTGGGSSSLWQIDDFAVGEPQVVEPGEPRLISEIQGEGDASPFVGETVTVTAIVTAVFQDSNTSDFGGFFLQEEDADSDGNPLTSEGIFVFEGNASTTVPDVLVGERVTLTATVDEFDGETQLDEISEITVAPGINPLPSAAIITADPNTSALVPDATTNDAGASIGDYERYEGMRVTIPSTLTVGDLFTLGRYGEIGLIAGGRILNFTQTNTPDATAYDAFIEAAVKRGIQLDDAFSDVQNADPAYPAGGLSQGDDPSTIGTIEDGADSVIRSGDTVTDLTGVIRYTAPPFDDANFRLIPTETPVFVSANPRPDTAPDVGGTLTVAGFNVLNFFTTIDTNVGSRNGPNIAGPAGNLEPRGAESEPGTFTTDQEGRDELERQTDKIVAAIVELDADIVGLVEIENEQVTPVDGVSGDPIAIQALVDALNAATAPGTYDFIDTGPIEGDPTNGGVEGDAIKVAFIYQPLEVTPVGDFAILDESVDPRFRTVDTQRPALAQAFEEDGSGEVVNVVVNHFKSKGSSAGFPGDENAGDGQASSNATRTLAAAALADWIDTDPTGSGDEDYLIIGDLNAYFLEDPIQTLLAGPDDDLATTGDNYVNLLSEDDYTFGFPIDLDRAPQIQTFGSLDYAIATQSLAEQVTGAEAWHISADEPAVLDYNLNFKSDSQRLFLYDDDPFRASDHDPVVVGLDLTSTAPAKTVIAGDNGPGRDRLFGSDDSEIFRPDGGTAIIVTGAGADELDISLLENGRRDILILTDFEPGQDLLDFDEDRVVNSSSNASGTVLFLDNGDVIRLIGVDSSTSDAFELLFDPTLDDPLFS